MDKAADSRTLKHIGSNIRAERARLGLTQEELATDSSLGTAQVARIERGETNSGITSYVRLARALGVPIATLMDGADYL